MRNKVLYITYDGLLDPLAKSQILPYIYGLSKKVQFSILSYEKKHKVNTQEYDKLNNGLPKKNINYYHLYFRNKIFLPLQIIQGFFYAKKIISKDLINLVHARSFIAGIIGFLLNKAFKVPYIFDMRGFWVEERIELGVLKEGILYKLLKKLEKRIMTNSSYIVVLTNAMKKELKENYKIKTLIEVIPTCVDLKKFQFSNNTYKKLKLVYFGSCGARYNVKGVIDFFEVINKNRESELILIINNPEFLDKYGSERIKNNKNITLLSKQSFDLIPKYLKEANVSIFFLNVEKSAKGVCATRFGESLALGLPVITNPRIGDFDEIITKNRVGLLVKDLSKNSYSRAIKELNNLLKDPELSKRCRYVAEKYFNLNNAIIKYQEIYKNARPK